MACPRGGEAPPPPKHHHRRVGPRRRPWTSRAPRTAPGRGCRADARRSQGRGHRRGESSSTASGRGCRADARRSQGRGHRRGASRSTAPSVDLPGAVDGARERMPSRRSALPGEAARDSRRCTGATGVERRIWHNDISLGAPYPSESRPWPEVCRVPSGRGGIRSCARLRPRRAYPRQRDTLAQRLV